MVLSSISLSIIFQSTLLMRGATESDGRLCGDVVISIHAPHARSDDRSGASSSPGRVFQSTLLMRGATQAGGSAKKIVRFQSTLLMRGATVPAWLP